MLDGRGDDVIARLHQAKQRQVDALGAAAGEDDLRRTAVQQLRNLLARMLHRRARLLSLLMNGRCIAELLEEVGTHGLKHFGKKRSGGVVVEVDPMHFSLYSGFYSNVLVRFGAGKRGFGEEARLPSVLTVWPNGARHENRVLPISVCFSRLVGVESPQSSRTLGWVLQEKVGQRRYQLSRSRG